MSVDIGETKSHKKKDTLRFSEKGERYEIIALEVLKSYNIKDRLKKDGQDKENEIGFYVIQEKEKVKTKENKEEAEGEKGI